MSLFVNLQCKVRRIAMSHILGLPLNTWLIVGGSFILSSLAPLIVANVILKKKEKNNE